MLKQAEMTRKLGAVFNPQQANVLSEVITEAYNDLVKTSDFNELKEIVKTLAVRMDELAQAQQRTENRLEELAQAQQRTENRVEELAVALRDTQEEIRTLARRVDETNSAVGGLGQSMAYALENEAYRMLPSFLKEKYGIEITERMVRTETGGEEINIFGRGRRNGNEVLIVGETKLRLDERRRRGKRQRAIFAQLEAKMRAVQAAFPEKEIVPVIITHYARPRALDKAEEEGIIVVQSFEW